MAFIANKKEKKSEKSPFSANALKIFNRGIRCPIGNTIQV